MKLMREEVDTLKKTLVTQKGASLVPLKVLQRLLEDRVDFEVHIRGALDNIGVPGEGYPANITLAYRTLMTCLEVEA